MRYLKKYNEYNSSNVIEDIKDILLELQDAGYLVEYSLSEPDDVYKWHEIFICKELNDKLQIINWDDIKEYIIRLDSYVKENGGNCKYFNNGYEWEVNDGKFTMPKENEYPESQMSLAYEFDSMRIMLTLDDSINEDFDHLSSRGINPDVTYFVHDEESNNTYFFLYNLSGDCVGYQKYNPNNPKEGGLGWMGRYFTKVHKEATGHSKIAVYGLETYDFKKDYFFVAEGVFDIIKIHNMGEPGIANLGCSLSRQAKNWYNSLSQKKIVIQDRDDAGTELGAIGDWIYTVPEPYKDLGEMPQDEVNEFIKNIKKEIGI